MASLALQRIGMVHSLSVMKRGFAFGKLLDKLIGFLSAEGRVGACFFIGFFSSLSNAHTHTNISQKLDLTIFQIVVFSGTSQIVSL